MLGHGCFVFFFAVAFTLVLASDEEVRSLLREGDKLLLKGRSSYQEAVAKYTQAVNLQPDNVKALYRRAELYSMMKAHDLMSVDLDLVLRLEANHRQGLVLRSKHRAAIGLFAEAAEDFQRLVPIFEALKKGTKAKEAAGMAHELQLLAEQWRTIEPQLENEGLSIEERRHVNGECIGVLARAIEKFAKDNVELRLRRAQCALAAQDQRAISDEVKFVLKRDPNNLRAIAIGARAFRALGAIDQAKSEIKRCLALDQENVECRQLHKAIRALEKQTTVIRAAIQDKNWATVSAQVDVALALEAEPANPEELWRWKCESLLHLRDIVDGMKACTTFVDYDPNNLDARLWRAEMHIMNDDLDAAEADVKKAGEFAVNNDRVREFQSKIEKLRKAKDRKDYYKILGVKKTANDQEIRRAFRKLAMRLHPDQLRSKELTEEERAKYDTLFRDINEAKEVLLDSEKRQRYDNGEDVTKPPEQNHHQNFHFNGGNFHFHFG